MAKTQNITNMEELNERVIDLSKTERQQQDTAKTISDVLQYIVDDQNKKAIRYKENFKNWVYEKLEHKIWKKYFPGKNKKEILIEAQKNDTTRNMWKQYDREIRNTNFEKDRRSKKDIFENIKRVFNKEITRHTGSDIDKEAGLYLLHLLGYFKDKDNETKTYHKNEVAHGERGKKWVTYDTGGTLDGLEVIPTKHIIQNGKHKGKEYVSLFNALAVLDEHDKKIWTNYIITSKNIIKPTSSTHIMYELFKELDGINPKYANQIKRFVDFVDKTDSKYYQFSGKDLQAENHTLFSLHKAIPIQKIYNYFKDDTHTGFEVLSKSELVELWVEDIKIHEKKQWEKIEILKALEKQWRFWNLNGKKFIFAKWQEFNGGQSISSHLYSWLFQIFQSGDLYIYHPEKLPSKICGFATDGHFLIIKKIAVADLEMILNTFKFGEDSERGIKESFLKYRKEIMEEDKREKEKKEIEITQKNNIQKNLNQLPELTMNDLKQGKIYIGIINNVQWKNIFVNISPTIAGLIKTETKSKELVKGETIKVKINTMVEENGKLRLNLEQVN